MAEYISREAFKARIREQQKKCTSPDEIAAFTVFSFLLQAVDEEPAADVQPVKWISVNDRLPENGDMVMCYCKTTTGEGDVHMFGTYLKEHWWLKTCRLHATLEMPQMKVMYWMPLPKPPKEGEQND